MLKIQKYHTETSNPEVPLPVTLAEITPSVAFCLFCCEKIKILKASPIMEQLRMRKEKHLVAYEQSPFY